MTQAETPAVETPPAPAAETSNGSGWILRLAAAVLALAAGAGAALAHPPFGHLWGLLGYPLLMWLSERTATRRGAFGLGWLAGFAYFLIGCWWVAEAFLVNADAHAWMAPFAAALLPAGLALFWGGATAAYRWLNPGHVGRVLLFAGLFCAFEWLRGHVLTGFPWNPAGAAWEAGSAPSQAAALIGVYGLSLLTVASVAALAVVFAPGDRKRRAGAVALGGLVLAGLFLGGAVRLAGARPEATRTIVRIVQADVDQQAKWTEENFRDIVERYINLTARPGAGATPDVIVWPEGALPATANDVLAEGSWVGEAMARAVRPGQTLLAGLSRGEASPDGEVRYYNSLIALHGQPDGGLRIIDIYDKHRLVPFGEYLPLGSLMTRTGLRSLVHVPSDFSSGPRPAPLDVDGAPRVQPLICYESLYPGFTSTRGGRPGWIVNVSNDAWFGRTSGPLQHLNLAAYRAIETGLPMVRATPTGVSALIDPWGRVRDNLRMEPGESGVIDAPLPRAIDRPPYAIYGDAAFGLILLAMLALGLRRRAV